MKLSVVEEGCPFGQDFRGDYEIVTDESEVRRSAEESAAPLQAATAAATAPPMKAGYLVVSYDMPSARHCSREVMVWLGTLGCDDLHRTFL
ncbi:uncharacterized protein A4U43_C04F10070 [Asparagus officinalis]|uniref:Uncharacterized protein n=1 Tax=Asparagus officinalis TaxID=4686 RepID=A0A5P1F068_ASPOF|nr:uncharacterized protein A4U43_C04F10070 [Asparagus officinalis]